LVQTGWVTGGDGLLALDVNGNGSIDDGSELFGEAFRLPDGTRARDGFEALRSVDGNSDGRIDAADAVYRDLRVWVDANADGVSQTSELRSLADLGITMIQTGADPTIAFDNGNFIGLLSTYTTAAGETRTVADVWFRIIPVEGPAQPQVVGTLPPEPESS
jgi:hypothetical protein